MSPTLDAREAESLAHLVDLSLAEDHAREDVTSRLSVPEGVRGRFVVRNRRWGVPAGLAAVELTLERLGSDARVEVLVADGTLCTQPTDLVRLAGPLRDVLAAERTFLNLIGLLSGTATATRRYVDAAGPRCAILDTRKTLPGYRLLQKYAVRCGGGVNHRPHLAGGILLKDNHRHPTLDLAGLVAAARREHPSLPLVVEVDTMEQLREVLALDVDRVLLDNFEPDAVRVAVGERDRRAPKIRLEVSGGLTLERIRAFADAGADCASVGALTHSAPVWDVGLDEIEAKERA